TTTTSFCARSSTGAERIAAIPPSRAPDAMLSLIKVRNYAIIDEVELELERGFSVMTGETGAGKSILVDALGLALGDRADASTVRSGAERPGGRGPRAPGRRGSRDQRAVRLPGRARGDRLASRARSRRRRAMHA